MKIKIKKTSQKTKIFTVTFYQRLQKKKKKKKLPNACLLPCLWWANIWAVSKIGRCEHTVQQNLKEEICADIQNQNVLPKALRLNKLFLLETKTIFKDAV